MLALQGGVAEHRELLEELGAEVTLVRAPGDLHGPDGPRVDGLVLPGGESSVMDKLARIFELDEPLRRIILTDRVPTLGTCAGLVMLAHQITDPAPGQQSLRVLDITVARNALGPQVDSAETRLTTPLGEVEVAFIRAPVVTRLGAGVESLGEFGGHLVGARSGSVAGISFHPELTGEPAFHRWLLDQARAG